MASKRIGKEYAEISASPPEGMTITLADDNIHNWKIILDGPENSPYAGGKFQLDLVLPTDYPFKPPKISFKTKIYHPNVSNDGTGAMCLGMLKTDAWKPSSKILSVLTSTQQLLTEPVPDDAVEAEAADLYKNKRPEFDAKAAEWTKQYAL